MNKLQLKWPVMLMAAALLFTACSKDDDDEGEGNEEEVITTVTLKLTPVGGGTTLQFSYDDPDGPGGASPVVAPVNLPANRQFNFEVELLDKTKNPVSNITTEVAAEAAEHRFYYLPSGGSNITISGLNNDANGVPLGTTGVLATGAPATGSLRVVLRHYGGNPPNKAAADAVDSPKSSTDVDVTFGTVLQ